MDPKRTTRASKKLSWLLRHGALEAGLEMDAAGWASVPDVLSKARISRPVLDWVIAHNNKSRFQLDGERVRASQGHSLETMPVDQAALEASWRSYDRSASLWHGTGVDVIESIAREGIDRGRRSHVHLAAEPDSTVGKRAGVHVLLEVSRAKLVERGIGVFESPNGVVLVRHVPVECIVGLRTLTRRAEARREELRGLLRV